MKRLLSTLTFISYLSCAAVFFLSVSCQNNTASSDSSGENAATESSTDAQPEPATIQDDDSSDDIMDVARSSSAHSTLVKAIEAAGIEHVLNNPGPLTVFAPTNAAFDKLPEGTLEDLLKPKNKGKLGRIITHHAAPGNYKLKDLKREAAKDRPLFMATNEYLEVTVNKGQVKVGGIAVQQSIPAANGVIHVVNEVILPE